MSINKIAVVVSSVFLLAACMSSDNNTLQTDGFGPIRLGAEIKSLPASSEGLYDRIIPEFIEEYDWEGYVYHVESAGERIATLTEDGGRIHAIDIHSDKLQTADGYGLHDTVAEILAAGGIASCDNYGFEGLLLKGMLYSGMELSPSGQKKAEIAYLDGLDQTFSEEDFIPGTHPTKITLAKWIAKE